MKKYKLSILNTLSSILILLMIVQLVLFSISSTGGGGEAWGGVAIFSLLIIGGIGLLIDWIIQRIITNRLLANILEASLLILVFIFSKWNQREKTITIEDNFKGYVTIVYNVKDERPLSTGIFTWSYNVEIPKSGILFTSTKQENDIWNTRFKNKSGDILDNYMDSTKLHATPYKDGDFNCKKENWKFRTWFISNENGWNKLVDIDTTSIKAMNSKCLKRNN